MLHRLKSIERSTAGISLLHAGNSVLFHQSTLRRLDGVSLFICWRTIQWFMTETEISTDCAKKLLNSDEMTRLNVAVVLMQAGRALKRGNKRRAAVLFGVAALATRNKRLSYAIRGTMLMNDVRKKLTGPRDASESD